MIGAIVKDNLVENIIVLNEEQVLELQRALNCEIVDARPHGLAIGDLRTANGWTRNAGGEQTILPLLEQEQYDSYTKALEHAAQVEAEAEYNAQASVDEAIAILEGEVEE